MITEGDRARAAAGVRAVRGMLAEWQALRAELRAIEEAEHPAVTDKFGRVWTWVSGDLWHHDDTLAVTRDMIERDTLPAERIRNNPNYWQLCEICRSQWADSSPVSPRMLLKGQGWFDVRDRKFYAAQEGEALYSAPVVWHFARYGNPGNGPFDGDPSTYRPHAEREAANRLAAGWASAEVVTVPVPPHAYHPGMFSAAGQKCARCDQLAGHALHS